MKNVQPSSLDLQYRIWQAGTYLDPREVLADIDFYFKRAFCDPSLKTSIGLLVTCDGKPWNSHEYFDTAYNLTTWFEAARMLASGESRSVDVWDWEESQCKMSFVGEDLEAARTRRPPPRAAAVGSGPARGAQRRGRAARRPRHRPPVGARAAGRLPRRTGRQALRTVRRGAGLLPRSPLGQGFAHTAARSLPGSPRIVPGGTGTADRDGRVFG